MAKLKDSRCFITRWLVFCKCVQLVQSLLRSFQSPSSFFLILKKKIHTSFCFLGTSKLISLQFLLFTLVCFWEKNGGKNLTINLNKFLLTSGGEICDALRESPWRARCTWEATYEVVQRHHIKIYWASFFLSHVKFIPF